MKIRLAHPSLSFLLIPLVCALRPGARADPVPVRQVGGTIHGLIEVRSEDGRVVASGDLTRVAAGDRITNRTVMHFKDGSLDDETVVFSQRHTLQVITYHHIQRGASFPHPIDLRIEERSGEVTVRSTGKDGKEEVNTEHMDLPADLANGMIPVLAENLSPNAGATTTVSMVIAMPKPRLVKLVITNFGEDNYSLAGFARKAIHYEIKIELGGVAGVVAPIIGKEPPHLQIWTIGGAATSFAREVGPLYPEGPMMTIQLASPVWPSKAAASR